MLDVVFCLAWCVLAMFVFVDMSLFVGCCLLFVLCRMWFVDVGRCVLFVVVWCLLVVDYCRASNVFLLLIVVACLLLVGCWSVLFVLFVCLFLLVFFCWLL